MPKRSGRPRKYGDEFRNALLAKIGAEPPGGLARRDCPAPAGELNASKNAAWKCLPKEGIHLERQGTRRASADPELAEKSADIAGLCPNPPENAAARRWWREGLRYGRNGTSSLHAALEMAAAKIFAKPAKSKTGKGFLVCMDGLLRECPEREGQEFHIIMDSCRARKKNDA